MIPVSRDWIRIPKETKELGKVAGYLQRRYVSRNEYPLTCEKCSTLIARDAHHFDYSYPLMVIYLCVSCHIRLHMLMERIGISGRRQRNMQRASDNVTETAQITQNESYDDMGY